MGLRHLTEFRDVTIDISGAPMPVDAYKAVSARVEQIEASYANDNTIADIGDPVTPTAVKSVLTGTTPFKIYVFDVYADVSAGTYNFEFVEEAPNVEGAASL